MARKCFLSFHYKPDAWRVSQVKRMGAIEGQPLLTANQWEEVKKKGDDSVKKWITDNMQGKTCLIVLVGENTAGRRWVKHEIKSAWQKGKGVFVIHIHNLKGQDKQQSKKGANPFSSLTVGDEPLTKYALVYDPPHSNSTDVYSHIAANIESWIERAITLRKAADASA